MTDTTAPWTAAEFWESRCLDCVHPQHEMTCHELVPNGDPSNGPAYCPCAVQIDLMEQEIVRQREAIESLLALVGAADAEVSVVHDLVHKTGTTLTELDAAIWRIHDILRPAIKEPPAIVAAARKPE